MAMSDAAMIAAQPAPLAALFARPAAMVPDRIVEPAPAAQTLLDDAFARGHAEGLAAARADLLPVQELLDAGAVALRRAGDVDTAMLRTPFAALVTRLCVAVIGAELRLAPDHVLAMVDAALAAVVPDGAMVLRLNPLDAALLDETATALPLPVQPDAAVARGSLYIDAPHYVIADSFAARLDAVLEAVQCR